MTPYRGNHSKVTHREEARNVRRIGYIYEKMAEWDNIVEAESKSTKRKTMNYGVKQHIKNRIKYLCEIQQNVLDGTMRTGEYRHESLLS